MNIQQALSDVAEIRKQLDQSADLRGFRSTATGISALLAILGAVVQSAWVTQPQIQVDQYMSVWLSVAVASSVVAGIEMLIRGFRSRDLTATGVLANRSEVWKTHRNLIGNLFPSWIVGGVLTYVIANQAIEGAGSASLMWMLPGLWSVIFGLGIWAARHNLPAATGWVAAFYLLGGILCLLLNSQIQPLAPWQMVALFGVGQTLLGIILYWNVERKYG